MTLQPVKEVPRVDQRALEKGHERQFHRQHHFEIVRRMQGVLVVLLVAGPEQDRVVPAQEADDTQKERVQRLGLEDRFVAKFMEGIQEERPERAVQQEISTIGIGKFSDA